MNSWRASRRCCVDRPGRDRRRVRRRGPRRSAAARRGVTKPCQACVKVALACDDMRDFLAATRDRVVVFDGGMGATLEQFDLSLERDYKLPGRCHEALVLNRPDVIQGVHESMVAAGAEGVGTDTFPAPRIQHDGWGLGGHGPPINPKA